MPPVSIAPDGYRTKWRFWVGASIRLFMLVLLLPQQIRGQDAVSEYELKAAFLFNIAKYTRWPATAFADQDAPLVIGVLGRDRFGGALDRVVQGRQIEGRRVAIRRGDSPAEMRGCHLVFVSDSEHDRVASHCAALEGMRILTVGDAPQRATAIVFYLNGGHLSFGVSLPAAERGQVQVSAKLLKLAREVIRQPSSAITRSNDS